MTVVTQGAVFSGAQSCDFPIDALPEPIATYIDQQAAAFGIPPDLVGLPTIAALSIAIGNSRRIRLKGGWGEPAQVYASIVASPGKLKTPALERPLTPILRGDDNPRRWANDITVEKLGSLLHDNPRGILVVRDELAGWVKSMNQYKGGKGADKEFYLSAWSGSPVRVDRQNGTELFIPRPFLSVIGGIQPDLVATLDSGGGIADGFLPRILFAWPDEKPLRWNDTTVSESTQDAYLARFDELFALLVEDPPIILNLTEKAQTFFIRWHDSHCEEGEQPHLSPFMQGVYAKLKGYCPRLALIHALAKDPQATAVGIESVAAGAALIDYFKAQALKVDAMLGPGKWNPVERCKQELRRKLSGCRYVGKRDLQRKSMFDASTFKQAIAEMAKPELEVMDNMVRLNR